VWTPKRIVLLVVGFALFFAAYIAYAATSLGRINTLPPLPDMYKKPDRCQRPPVIIPPKNTRLDGKLQQAFGPDCKELKRPIRLELNSKSMALAAEDFAFQQSDGRVKVQPLSLAIFGKNKKPGADVEINTIRSKVAYIKFDRPVHTPYDVNGSKIDCIELIGSIQISNNRGTLLRDDDLTLWIPTGPLFYDEKQKRIWTHDDVHLTDERTRPRETTVDAHGMVMDLLTEAPPPKPGDPPHKSRHENVIGVKRIVLLTDVRMDLYLGGPGLFGNNPARDAKAPTKAAKPKGKSAEDDDKAHVTITTPGSFEYLFGKENDLALFQAPTGAPAGQSVRAPQHVTLVRHHERRGETEQLVCHRLELKLRRKEHRTGSPAGGDDKLEIETAHATGKEVLLTSDPEHLIAHGNDFYHDAVRKLTILKGDPEVEVDRDETIIHARALHLQDVPGLPGSPGRQDVLAYGPGQIDLADKKTHKKNTHAFWKDRLTSTRDGTFDLLVLTGEARFLDDAQGQSLSGETLKLWLLPQAKEVARVQAAEGKPASGEPSRRPHHLEALGHVVAHSRELDIHDSSRLMVNFMDVPASLFPGRPAPARPKAEAGPAVVGPPGAGMVQQQEALKPAGPPSPLLREPGPESPLTPPASAAAPAAAARPIDLSAYSIEVTVLRCGEQNALKHMSSRGQVRVRQDPAKPTEDGVDISGDTLTLDARPEGNKLVVTSEGEHEHLATLSMDKIDILGPVITIDQAINQAWVDGPGAMSMRSNTNLQGQTLNRTVPLNIQWNNQMLFYGDRAEFMGDIQADQETSHLACQQLQVFFDRTISLKEGNRQGGQPARVRNLVGDKKVHVEDTVKKGNELVKFEQLTGIVIHIVTEPPEDAEPGTKQPDTSQVELTGPGTVRIVQRGGTDPTSMPGQPGSAPTPVHVVAPQGQEPPPLKLTYVGFERHMKANNRSNTATFFGNVRVFSTPCENPHMSVDLDTASINPPEGAFFLQCERLRVSNQPSGAGGRPNQEMFADGAVRVFAKDFQADADHMTYNEEKDQLIFTSEGNQPVSFWKRKTTGELPQTLRAKKVIYSRRTGKADMESVDGIKGYN
jgi:hypothetical protein